jgi:hypothetical protein
VNLGIERSCDVHPRFRISVFSLQFSLYLRSSVSICGFSFSTLTFHMHRRSVTQNFRDPLPDFRRVITNSDHRVGAQFRCMRHHLLKRIFARLFAKRPVNGNIPAKNRLDGRAEISDNGSRPHNNSANDAKGFDHAITGQIKSGGGERMCITHLARKLNTIRAQAEALFGKARNCSVGSKCAGNQKPAVIRLFGRVINREIAKNCSKPTHFSQNHAKMWKMVVPDFRWSYLPWKMVVPDFR